MLIIYHSEKQKQSKIKVRFSKYDTLTWFTLHIETQKHM